MRRTDPIYIEYVLREYEKIRAKLRPTANSDGGPGSGYKNHPGNPGHVGGSVSRSETVSNAIDHSLRDAVITVNGEQWERDGDYWMSTMSGELQDNDGFKKLCIENADKVELYRSNQKTVDGKDLLSGNADFEYDTSKYEFAIDAAVAAQGYDGIPKIVTAEEFENAVSESSFVAQRTYSASNLETLESYRNDLYNGKFYIDCSNGGSQYGQGMYCAASYDGNLSEGIKSEMKHYQQLGADRAAEKYGATVANEYMRHVTADEYNDSLGSGSIVISDEELKVLKKLYFGEDENGRVNLTNTEQEIIKSWEDEYIYRDIVGSFANVREYMKDDIAMGNPVTGYSYTETFTLDKSAKIVKYGQIEAEYQKYIMAHPFTEVRGVGMYAALRGYDAINAEGHGDSGSYTIVLNRTKMIIKEHDENDEIKTKSDYCPRW